MQSLRNGLTVLTELSRFGGPASLADIAELVGLHKSTVHRMLAAFIDFGLVRQEGSRYVIGLAALELTRSAQGGDAVANPVHSAIADLHLRTQARAIYAVPQFRHMTCVVASERGEVTFPIVPVYAQLPLHCTAAGKAYLAHRSDSEIDRYAGSAPFPGGTARAVVTGPDLLRQLAQTRQRGFAIEDREFSVHGRAVAVPVLDRTGSAVASVAVGVPASRSHPAQQLELAEAAQECARCISAAIYPGAGDRRAP